MNGYIHSFESLGTVDGPGARFVTFLQGCPLRCKYCHNPDTWGFKKGKTMTVEAVVEQYEKNKAFATGGITVTGGEPLVQIEFVIELFTQCKALGAHTALDTSGITFRPEKKDQFDRLMAVTDLVLLDIKHIDTDAHKELVGFHNEPILAFAKYLSDINKPMWVRHVVIPGITLNDEYLKRLGYFLAGLKNIKALDLIPYHTMAKPKYDMLNLPYPLEGVPATTKKESAYALEVVMSGIKEQLSLNLQQQQKKMA